MDAATTSLAPANSTRGEWARFGAFLKRPTLPARAPLPRLASLVAILRLMLLDFDHHRADRRALSIAFKPGPMRHYADSLNRGISARMGEWGSGEMRFYPAIKQLTLDLAADSFIGLPFGPEADRINQAFVDMVQASIAPVRRPLPFTKLKKGSPFIGRQCLNEKDDQTVFKIGDTVVVCPVRGQAHHADCWVWNGGRCYGGDTPCPGGRPVPRGA